MGRFPVLIALGMAVLFAGWYFVQKSENKPSAVAGGSQKVSPGTSSAQPSPSATPTVQVMTASLDHRFKDALVTTEGEIIKEGAVIKQGIVATVHGANATVLRPDGGTTWIGTDRENITTEMMSACGTVTAFGPLDGEEGHLDAVMMTSGAVYRLGRECRQGLVVAIKPGEIRIEREDGGIHLIGFGSSRGVVEPRAGSAVLSQTNSIVRGK